MNKSRANKRLLVSAVAGLSLLLTACGGGAQNNSDQAKGEDAFEIKNCGETLHFDKPAERAVTVEQGATDTVLSLGQGTRSQATVTKKVRQNRNTKINSRS